MAFVVEQCCHYTVPCALYFSITAVHWYDDVAKRECCENTDTLLELLAIESLR